MMFIQIRDKYWNSLIYAGIKHVIVKIALRCTQSRGGSRGGGGTKRSIILFLQWTYTAGRV